MTAFLKILTATYALYQLVTGSQLSSLKEKLNIQDLSIPQIDLSSSVNDEIALLGDFEDLTFYRYTGQENFTGSITETEKDLIYYSNGTFIKLDSLSDKNATADINHIIPFGDDSFILSGTGTLPGGHNLEQQLLYNLSSLEYTAIFNQSISTVNDILADDEIVYFGGEFQYTLGNSTGHSVVLWNSTTNEIQLLPFKGFGSDSVVNSILRLDNDNIVFAGKFNTLDDNTLLKQIRGSNSSKNATDIEFDQLIPLKHAGWSSQGSLEHSSLICPSEDSDGWFQEGTTTGDFTVSLLTELRPSKLRIYNAFDSDYQVSLFRIITSPANGIMNLTYLDPQTGELSYCDAWCPLLSTEQLEQAEANVTISSDSVAYIGNNNTNIKWTSAYQEFAFVNEVSVESLTFLALDSYGSSVGLDGFEMYQNGYPTFANDTLNQPNCDNINSYPHAVTSSTQQWTQGSMDSSYILSTYDGTGDLPSVNFYPNITYAGDYTLNMVTPGCIGDDSCSSRGIVNVTVWDQTNDTVLSTKLIYQNNNDEKYDLLYSGYLESAPKITLKFYESINTDSSSSIMVADRIDVIIDSIDQSKIGLKTINETLNGLFQYQISNFTSISNDSLKIGNTTINRYSIENVPSNSELFAGYYNNTLLVDGAFNGIAVLQLNDDLNIISEQRMGTGGPTEGINTYSNGLLFLGDFNLSSQQISTLSYNGTFSSFGNLRTNITRFNNVTIDDSELLVFNNRYIFNVSSNEYIRNSSSFALSLWSAGSNSKEDGILVGAVSQRQYTELNGAVYINGANRISTIGLPSFNEKSVYTATYINDSSTAYAYSSKNDSTHHVLIARGNYSEDLPVSWPHAVNTMIYNKDDSLLAVGTNAGDTNGTSLSLFNISNSKMIGEENLGAKSSVNAIVAFNKNSSLLVGGDFTIDKDDTSCSGLCLYNYNASKWSNFYNNSISGNITDLQFFNGTQLLISGNLYTKNETGINLAKLNMVNNEVIILRRGSTMVQSFVAFDHTTDELITQSDNEISYYTNGEWKNLTSEDFNDSHYMGAQLIPLRQTSSKRDVSNRALLVNGDLKHSTYGSVSAMLYDFEDWVPYFIADGENAGRASNIFMNKDLSSLYTTQTILQGSNTSTSTTSSNMPSETSDKNESSSDKIDRGFVVLIGLALAIGTVAVLGGAGAIIAYFFAGNKGQYEPLKPRVDEGDMIDTVPPEKLMKFV